MNEKIRIQIASMPHREKVVAELWFENEVIAELSNDTDNLLIEIYPRQNAQPWSLPFEELIEALQKAKRQLLEE